MIRTALPLAAALMFSLAACTPPEETPPMDQPTEPVGDAWSAPPATDGTPTDPMTDPTTDPTLDPMVDPTRPPVDPMVDPTVDPMDPNAPPRESIDGIDPTNEQMPPQDPEDPQSPPTN